jgi:hypothetical protein
MPVLSLLLLLKAEETALFCKPDPGVLVKTSSVCSGAKVLQICFLASARIAFEIAGKPSMLMLELLQTFSWQKGPAWVAE